MQKLIFETETQLRNILYHFKKPAIACSFGMDSMVALYFCRKIKPDIPVIFVNTGNEYPDIYDFQRKITQEWKLNLITIPPKHSFRWVTERHGFPVLSKANTHKWDRKYLPAHYCCLYIKKRPLEQHIKKAGYDVVIDGLRSEESELRKFSIKKYGILHFNRGQQTYRYHAISEWTREQEIEAIMTLNIPISDFYKKTMKDMIIRTGCWCCTLNWKHKKNQFLMKYYKKLWKVLMKNFGFAKFLITKKIGVVPTDEQTDEKINNQPCYFDTI